MPLDWTPLADALDRHRRFLVTTHVRPDGDALGSAVAMAGLIEARGRSARIVNASPTPPRYAFLDPDHRIARFGDPGAAPADLTGFDALIILDLSSWSQLREMGDYVRAFPGERLVIDHHVSEDDLGAVMLKDTAAEATGTLVLDAARHLGVTLTPEMAKALATAIAMDTGWFRHPNVKPSTLRDAAELVEAGADLNRIYRLLFERNTAGRVRMQGEAMAAIRLVAGGRVAYSAVTRDDFARTGAIPPDTEDLIDATVSIEGVEVGLLFIEQPQSGIKLSLRSRAGFDCAALAGQFGGGGHRAAAGANLADPLDEALPRVLAAVEAALPSASPR